MKLGMLITSIGNFGKKGFYNSQEIGLAREMDKLCDEVLLYKAVPMTEEKSVSGIEGCSRTTFYRIPVKSRGINGIWDCSVMDKSIDALLFFSDTQLSVPAVHKWCRQNGIPMYPYIGAIESHSTSRAKRLVIDQMFKKNLKAYRACTCFAKTPTVQKALQNKGVKDCIVAPVGLDIALLHAGYEDADVQELKKKYGYQKTDKVLLFIGRMTAEKQPLKMIEIFRKLYNADQSYRLLMVGKGELLDEVKAAAKTVAAENHVEEANAAAVEINAEKTNAAAANTAMANAATVDAAAVNEGTANAATVDAATVDAGTANAATVDAGMLDAAAVDAGMLDAAAVDAGMIDTAAVDSTGNKEEFKESAALVQMIEQIPNRDIWELYRIADCFVNLNQQEIFGMAILEAMYYGCKVVAMHAPGPDFIIEDGVSGYLAGPDDELMSKIRSAKVITPHDRIEKNFLWSSSTQIMYNTITRQ